MHAGAEGSGRHYQLASTSKNVGVAGSSKRFPAHLSRFVDVDTDLLYIQIRKVREGHVEGGKQLRAKWQNENLGPVSLVPGMSALLRYTLATLALLVLFQVCTAQSPIYGNISEADYLIGKFDATVHHNTFVQITSLATNYPMWMRRDALSAWERLYRDMLAQNPTLPSSIPIISALRNLTSQGNIWNGKWTGAYKNITNPVLRGLGILEYSSMPGTSRHHWGTGTSLE